MMQTQSIVVFNCIIMILVNLTEGAMDIPGIHRFASHEQQKKPAFSLQGEILSNFRTELMGIDFNSKEVLNSSRLTSPNKEFGGAENKFSLMKRSSIVDSPNHTELFDFKDKYFFSTNISVGTPPQHFEVIIDTTSSDVVIPNSTFRTCVKISEGQCALDNTFKANESSTYKATNLTYNFERLNSVYLSGEYFKDDLNVSGFVLNNTQMALANDSSGATLGILGLGSTSAQGVANSSDLYDSFLSILIEKQTVYERVYSLWQQTNVTNNKTTGNLLIGGIDTSQYLDPLYILPMVPIANRAQPYEFGFVSLTGISVSSQNVSQTLTSSSFEVPVLLDSSNSISYLPYEATVSIASQLTAYYVESIAGWIQTCEFRDLPGTVNFEFNNATIRVPVSNLLLDMFDNNGDPILFNNGQRVCVLALTSANTEGYSSLGVGILSAMYTVFDFDTNQIAIAEIDPHGLSNKPNITVLAQNLTEVSGVTVLGLEQADVTVGSPTATYGLAEGNLLPYYVVPTKFENEGFTASLPSIATAAPNLFSQTAAGNSSTTGSSKSQGSTLVPQKLLLFCVVFMASLFST